MNTEFRNVTKFLAFPKTIDGKTKWLTKASWQEYRHYVKKFNWFNIIGGSQYEWSEWEPYKWIEK